MDVFSVRDKVIDDYRSWPGASPEWFERRARFLRAPEAWTLATRAEFRAELDAAYFHLFGIGREDVDYIMETFPIVKRKDIAAFGSYRTQEATLDVYDAMRTAVDSGVPNESPFDKEAAS